MVVTPSIALALVLAAQVPVDSWSDAQGAPYAGGTAATFVAGDPDCIYATLGAGLQKFQPSTSTWTTASPVPLDGVFPSAVTAMPGTTLLYAILSSGAGFARYDTATDGWTLLATVDYPGFQAGAALVATATRVYAFQSRNGQAFWEYDPGTDEWKQRTSPGSIYGTWSMVCPGAGDTLYVLRAFNTPDVLCYSISADAWTPSTPLPENVSEGGALCVGPGGAIYCLKGPEDEKSWPTSRSGLFKYDLVLKTWAALASSTSKLPGEVREGAGIAWPGGDELVCFRGSAMRDIWRYSTSMGRFLSAIAPAPDFVGRGGALVGVNNGRDLYLAAGQGSSGLGSTSFSRYSMDTDSWTRLAPTPAEIIYSGGGLVYGGGDVLFAAEGYYPYGGDTNHFWRYAISTNAWTEMAAMPEKANVGSRMTWAGGDFLYATFGAASPSLWRYSIPGNAWTRLADAPAAPPGQNYDGGILTVYPGSGDLIYGYRSDRYSEKGVFVSYSILNNVWQDLGAFPGGYQYQIALCSSDADHVLALTNAGFYTYSISGHAWTGPGTPPPGTVGAAVSVASAGTSGTLYVIEGNSSRTFWVYGYNNAPAFATAPAQVMLDGETAIPQGGETAEAGFKVIATATDVDEDEVRIEVECRPLLTAFSDLPTDVGAFGAEMVSVPLAPGGYYHWQARLKDFRGKVSAWFICGTTPDNVAEIDIATRGNLAPGLAQLGQSVALGGSIVGGASATFEALLQDPDGDPLRFEVRLTRLDAPGEDPIVLSTERGAAGPVSLRVDGLRLGSYRWEGRVADLEVSSAWLSFGGNNDGDADFRVLGYGSTGTAGCGQSAAGGLGLIPVLLGVVVLLAIRR